MVKWSLGAFLALIVTVVFSSHSPVHALAFPSACTSQTGTVYNVGDEQDYATIGAVPFDELQPGALVRIHHRAAAYREKIIISTSGTQAAPICVVGVPGQNGELPVIDGENATISSNMISDQMGNQDRALLMIAGQEWEEIPSHIHIEGLHFKNADVGKEFINSSGNAQNYRVNAGAIWIQRGHNVTITGTILSDSQHGLFVSSSGDVESYSKNITLQYSHIYGNGTRDSDQQHNIYTESDGMLIQFNRFDPVRAESGGNNIKDRSAGTIIRYNWIDSGAHLIDLVEGEDAHDILNQNPNYDKAWVYGNIMISPETDGVSRNMLHFGGDLGGEEEGNSTVCGFDGGQDPTECYRKGPLYFYNNTVITYANQEGDGSYCCRKTLFRLQTDEQYMEAFNNIFHVVSLGDETWVSYMNKRGRADFGVNLLKPASNMAEFYSQDGPNSAVTGLQNMIVLTDSQNPGFVNEANRDYHLLADSLAINRGETITNPDIFPVEFEYLVHQGAWARIDDGAIDLGAFEQGSNPPLATNTPPATATTSPAATATQTPDGGGSTATPPPTVDPAVNLLSNGSFEADANQDGQLDGWILKNGVGEKQKCNKPGKTIALEGNCAFQSKSAPGENSKLEQTLANDVVISGDSVTLSGFIHAKGTVNAGVKVRVKYTDLNLEKGKITAKFVLPTTGYVPFTGELTLPITGAVSGFKVKLQNKGTSGKVWFDGLALVKGSNRLLDLPVQ